MQGVVLLLWYGLWGLVHELAHLLVVVMAANWRHADETHQAVWTWDVLSRALLGRYVVVHADEEESSLHVARHAGWMTSCVVAIICHVVYRWQSCRCSKKSSQSSSSFPSTSSTLSAATLAAYVTALEAMATDLCGVGVPSQMVDHGAHYSYLFCGNFGLVLLQPAAWMIEPERVLDVLEHMVQVTMMRGAQQGGVVTFVPNSNGARTPRAVRSRTVNGKRTDLAHRLRRQMQVDAAKKHRDNKPPRDAVRGFFGHTRFATSSKAEFDGTHPHQWVPPTKMPVYYPFANPKRNVTRPTQVTVEHYITHNGDLDFFRVQGTTYDLATLQRWLPAVTHAAMPSPVDSAAIAGLVDVIRTQGCWPTAVRFALALGLSTSRMATSISYPSLTDLQRCVGRHAEAALEIVVQKAKANPEPPRAEDRQPNEESPLQRLAQSPSLRQDLAAQLCGRLQASVRDNAKNATLDSISKFIKDDEVGGASWMRFCQVTVDAFLDHDLLFTMRYLLDHAKGSFGLCITSSLDAAHQVCLAARGQTMSIAMYPETGLLCYGSEQAAVKAGWKVPQPGQPPTTNNHNTEPARRLDLDDLTGEIVLLDWGSAAGDTKPAISPPHQHLPVVNLMHGKLRLVLLAPARKTHTITQDMLLRRMVLLDGNPLITALPVAQVPDLIQQDLYDIPKVCSCLQEEWKEPGLNRLTAWTFRQALIQRLQGIADGSIPRHTGSVDIFFTGCEVSLWLAEQVASDLQKALPRLGIQAVSSNKILGLFGQELVAPAIGYPMSQKTHDFKNAIVVIVSHSGGTFAPLACSNLLQSVTPNLFVVASEWDTQIGKQLRSMPNNDGILKKSRIFATGVGLRPAEPCSVSVAATHQILTQIFQLTCVTVLRKPMFRQASGALVTQYDLQVLERCHRDSIVALEHVVGMTVDGELVPVEISETEHELRAIGQLWAQHVLENAKAYIMTFLYIMGTVVSGYPVVTGIAIACGLDDEKYFYLTRFFDALIYFWLPQINILLLRLWEGRNWRHRMTGRTVVIGDCPWVAQAGEAFLSKVFACSYSIAGLNVHSGNPGDHLVHRHTHRVTRGSLLVCGRPDGRLSALTSLEASTCLSVNQASSIQSYGGTCESVTIGHNPYKLPLSAWGVFLESHRPNFLCETLVNKYDGRNRMEKIRSPKLNNFLVGQGVAKNLRSMVSFDSRSDDASVVSADDSDTGRSNHSRIQGIYEDAAHESDPHKQYDADDADGRTRLLHSVVDSMIQEKTDIDVLRKIFSSIDVDGNGTLDLEEFVQAFLKRDQSFARDDIISIFEEYDMDKNGSLDFEEFVKIARDPQVSAAQSLLNQDSTPRTGPMLDVNPTEERYFGESIINMYMEDEKGVNEFVLSSSQQMAMELYESRIASLQRFVAMTVMFHELGSTVQAFFPSISFGWLGYRIDRTHSIMRIATTASPMSGADVRKRMLAMNLSKSVETSISIVSQAWQRYRARKVAAALEQQKVTKPNTN